MTLSVLEGHSPIARLFSATFRIRGASRGPSASAELRLFICSFISFKLNRQHSAYFAARRKVGIRPDVLTDVVILAEKIRNYLRCCCLNLLLIPVKS